jgi:hypothetical protein
MEKQACFLEKMKKKYVKAKKGLFCSFQRGFIKDERQRLKAPAVLFWE